jgi:hypothetical protein
MCARRKAILTAFSYAVRMMKEGERHPLWPKNLKGIQCFPPSLDEAPSFGRVLQSQIDQPHRRALVQIQCKARIGIRIFDSPSNAIWVGYFCVHRL